MLLNKDTIPVPDRLSFDENALRQYMAVARSSQLFDHHNPFPHTMHHILSFSASRPNCFVPEQDGSRRVKIQQNIFNLLSISCAVSNFPVLFVIVVIMEIWVSCVLRCVYSTCVLQFFDLLRCVAVFCCVVATNSACRSCTSDQRARHAITGHGFQYRKHMILAHTVSICLISCCVKLIMDLRLKLYRIVVSRVGFKHVHGIVWVCTL